MNFSLSYNSVSFYQAMKLLCIPAVLLIKFVKNGETVSRKMALTLTVVLVGVGIATITDVQYNNFGLMMGFMAVATTAQFQIWQGSKAREYELNPLQITSAVAPAQVATVAFGIEGPI